MTFGDSFSFTMLVLLSGISLWASLLLARLLFPTRSDVASTALREKRRRCFLLGALGSVGGIGAGIGMLNAPAAPVKIAGFALIAAVGFTALLGGTALVDLAADSLNSSSTPTSPATRGKAAALLILAGLTPGIGWFLLFPLQLFANTGAGLIAVFSRKRPTNPSAP